MSGPMGKPPLWKNCTFSNKPRILYRTVEKFIISKIMPHTIKIRPESNCIPFLNHNNLILYVTAFLIG